MKGDKIMRYRQKAVLASLILSCFMFYSTNVRAEEKGETPWTTSGGAGGFFHEGSEDVYSNAYFELRQGYDLSPMFTLEGSIGGAPFFEGTNPDGRDNGGVRAGGLDLLMHIDTDADRTWDPYVSAGGGAMWYAHSRNNTTDKWKGHWGGGAGLGYNLSPEWQVRGDYRLIIADSEDTDQRINHTALALLTYRWGVEEAGQTSAAKDEKGSLYDQDGKVALNPVYFAYDSSKLTDTSKQTLKQNATVLNDKYKDKKVVVEGNCDERGTSEYNMALGQRRATSAFEFLRSLGVSGDRMSTVSYGKEKPVDPGHNEAAWAKNRRTDTVVLTK